VLQEDNNAKINQSDKIGSTLIKKGLINQNQLELCLHAQRTLLLLGKKVKLGEVIVDYGFARHVDIEITMTELGKKAEGIDSFEFPLSLLKRIQAFPIGYKDGILQIASAGLIDDVDKSDLTKAANELGLSIADIRIIPKNRIEVLQALNKMSLPERATIMAQLNDFSKNINDSSFLTKIIHNIYIDALQSRASDIHIFVSKNVDDCWISYRIDGALNFIYMVEPEVISVIATRIKSDAGIDFSDTIRPHDGKTTFKYGGRNIDVRISTLPVDFGESLVMRILDSTKTPSINNLFASHPRVMKQLANVVDMETKSGGILLVTGATGSGKSTTLNAIIRAIDRSKLSIKTVEDPVELSIPLVGQTSINELAGLTYSKILRSILRQDPDVIMVGELRDTDTVETAFRAAETGHMVMTTLHTGSVSESVTRLIGMLDSDFRNIGKYILSGSLKGILNQRLAKKLCTKCLKPLDKNHFSLEKLKSIYPEKDFSEHVFYESDGCNRCNKTGYYGRVIVPEALFINSEHKTRMGFEEILLKDLSFNNTFSLEGVSWYTKEEAVWAVLASGEIDIKTAIALLDRKDL
jgi:type II secretory ATPase GspE/PulE/Tfp pilus assembly ATPase PilB-like protein